MARTPIWKEIDQTLRREIAKGHYGPGDQLPTEAALATRFGVNRHTVRRALSELQHDDVVLARRGSGVFVTTRPTEYPIRRRVRFHEILEAAGKSAGKEILRLETRSADPKEAEALDLPTGSAVHVWEGLAIADDLPLSVFRSVFPAELLPGLMKGLEETHSVTAALKREGVSDYVRISTRLSAERATATQALRLQIRESAPLLLTVGINALPDGTPVEFGHSWFAGDRVQLIVEPESPK